MAFPTSAAGAAARPVRNSRRRALQDRSDVLIEPPGTVSEWFESEFQIELLGVAI